VVPFIITSNAVPYSSVQQFQAMLANRGKIVIACPEYFLPHVNPVLYDNLHLTAYGYRLLGEYIRQAVERIFLVRREWFPTMPISITEGTTTALNYQLVVNFATPYGDPLTIDTTVIAAQAGLGFSFADASGVRTPSSAVLSGPLQITFTFAAPFTSGSRSIAYATNPAYETTGALTAATIPGGNIRDTSARTSYFNDATGNPTPMHNWLVPFSQTF
jgi:hypothetical protein